MMLLWLSFGCTSLLRFADRLGERSDWTGRALAAMIAGVFISNQTRRCCQSFWEFRAGFAAAAGYWRFFTFIYIYIYINTSFNGRWMRMALWPSLSNNPRMEMARPRWATRSPKPSDTGLAWCRRSAQEVLLYHIGSANKQCTQTLQGKIDRIAHLDNMWLWHIFSDWKSRKWRMNISTSTNHTISYSKPICLDSNP